MTLLVGIAFSFLVSLFFVFKGDRHESFNGNVEYEVEKDVATSILSFQTKIFFLALLPPILFNSGYQLQRELFYRHIAPISLFACVGTCISGLVTGGLLICVRQLGLFGPTFYPTTMELMTFGSLIAATDTVSVVGILQAKQVDPHLFSLVFGESALNDAVAIVLYNSLSTFLVEDAFGDSSNLMTEIMKFLAHLIVQATCSPLLGMFYAFVLALAFKAVDLREHKMLELSLYIMPMYVPYMLGEFLNLSGMITIFFTGMFAKRYMEPNVSDCTKQHAEMLFKLFAFLAETCIFLELGLSVFGLSGKFQWFFIGWALLAALVGRAASIYPLAACYNLSLTRVVRVGSCVTCSDDTSISTMDSSSVQGSVCSDIVSNSTDGTTWSRETPVKRLDKRISLNFMHMLTFAGLRGAVAYACARDFPDLFGHRDSFVTATMAIVLFTIVIMGGGTEPLMNRLKIRTNVDEKEYMRHWHTQRKLKGRFHRFEYHYIYRLVLRQEPSRFGGKVADVDDSERVIKECLTPVIDNTGDFSNSCFGYTPAPDGMNNLLSCERICNFSDPRDYSRSNSSRLAQEMYSAAALSPLSEDSNNFRPWDPSTTSSSCGYGHYSHDGTYRYHNDEDDYDMDDCSLRAGRHGLGGGGGGSTTAAMVGDSHHHDSMSSLAAASTAV